VYVIETYGVISMLLTECISVLQIAGCWASPDQ